MHNLAQTANVAAIDNERLAIVLGIVALSLGLAAFASCRSCTALLTRLGLRDPTQNAVYRVIYKYHTKYWWGYGVALLSHVAIAVGHTGLPQSIDPDAPVHWAVLLLGLASAVPAMALFSTCRVSPTLMATLTPRRPFSIRWYKLLFQPHTYYWGAFLVLIAAHVTVSFLHTGIWPG